MALTLTVVESTVGALPTSGCAVGQTAYTTDYNKKWYWNGSVWLEQPGGAGGTAKARIYNVTDAAAVAGSEVTTTSTTYVRLRSGAVTLANTKEYQVQFGADGSDGGFFRSAKLVVV